MLADKLDHYKGRGNRYVNDNIQEIQELYVDEEIKKSSQTSFITDKVENLFKYMKFVQSSTQTRLFKPLPHYQSLKSRGEQDPLFWKEVATAFVN